MTTSESIPVDEPGTATIRIRRPADEKAVADLLAALKVDEGDHTWDTPARVAKAWREQLSGYREDPSKHLEKTFSAPADPGVVVVSGIRLASTCAHHMLPFVGTATVAYQPRKGQQVVGLSKLARVVHGYARRLQVQERIGDQVIEALTEKLDPAWSVVMITATHQCMTLRGVKEPDAATTTRSVRGWLSDSDLSLVAQSHAASLSRS